MGIWKDLLLRNFQGKYFKNAQTICAEHKDKMFQVFEVLVTETLAIIDPETKWSSYPVQGDNGIDFSGITNCINDPFGIEKPNQIILGQVKRRKKAYNKDDFKFDIIKIIKEYNSNFYKNGALLEIIHVLSSDKNVRTKEWINENICEPYPRYIINPLDAMVFFSFWKIMPSFLSSQLDGIFSKAELKPLYDYLDGLPNKTENIIDISTTNEKSTLTDEEFLVNLNICSNVDLAIPLKISWDSKNSNEIVALYPSKIKVNSISPLQIIVYKNLSLPIKFKFIKTGTIDLGEIKIYTNNNILIKTIQLGTVDVTQGIVNKFYSLPFENHINLLKENIISNKKFETFGIIGQGGVGKSSFAKEIMLFAQNNNYYAINVQKSNEFENDNYLILDILNELLYIKNKTLSTYCDTMYAIREILAHEYDNDWDKSFTKIITEQNLLISDYQNIANCYIKLFLRLLHNQSVILWISDMHWCSKNLIMFFKFLVNSLNNNKHCFNNNLIILFEGRDADTLNSEDRIVFPTSWIDFVESNCIKKIELFPWSDEHSKSYIKMLINPFNHKTTDDMLKVENLLMKYSSSNPMCIRELLSYLVLTDCVKIGNTGTIVLSKSFIYKDELPLEEIIKKRIQCYRNKFSDIIDLYILLSHTTVELMTMYSYVNRILRKSHWNYNLIEKKIGIISDLKATLFLHEFYKHSLQDEEVLDDNVFDNYIDYYEKNCSESLNSKIELMYLKSKQSNVDYSDLSKNIIDILNNEINDTQEFKCYGILTKIPDKYYSISKQKLHFDISEILIRIGSWRDSQKELENITDMPAYSNEEKLYKILAYKNLGNMYGVSLRLNDSFKSCDEGLKQIKIELKDFTKIDEDIKREYQRQYEMLLDRKAVTYWFSGQMEKSMPLFEESLKCAIDRKDNYSEMHTLYEMGMCQMHFDCIEGNKNISKALSMFSGKETYTEKQEKMLVKVELLISELLIYKKHHSNDMKMLEDIYEKSETICTELKNKNSNYEAALCYIVNAICCLYSENYKSALTSFYEAQNYIMLGEFDTLHWKICLNIAQTYMLLYNESSNSNYKANAIEYAKIGLERLRMYRNINADFPSYLLLTDEAVMCFENILEITHEKIKTNYEHQSPISVEYNNYLFYIMD